VGMADRDALWNVALPFEGELRDSYVMAESMAGGHHKGGEPLRPQEACIWDAGWPHAGQGNPTKHRRVLLHLALAPYWMVCLKTNKAGTSIEFPKGLDRRVREDLLNFDKVTPSVLQHLHGATSTSAKDDHAMIPRAKDRIQIYWDGENTWFNGTVRHVRHGSKGTVIYDDDEVCEEDFGAVKWRFAPTKGEAVPHSSISKEFNNGRCIHDRKGGMATWVDRVFTSLPSGS